MKTEVHPKYFPEAIIRCANCKAEFQIGTTRDDIQVEICSQCHPFFTGKNMLIDREGRVDKFKQKMEGATGKKTKVRKKKTLEEKVNEELSIQLQKEAVKEEKVKVAKAAKAGKKAVPTEE